MRGGYYKTDWHDTNVTNEPRYTWTTTNNIGFLDVPASLQHGTGFTSIPTNTGTDQDQFTRAFFHVDGTVYASAGGEHQVKFGMQFDRTGNKVLSGELRPRVTLRWDAALPATSINPGGRGTYGYYSVRSQTADPTHGFITQGDIHSNNVGFFVQDAWTLSNKLTLNLGIRTEREEVPTYTTGADIPEFGVEFGYKDKFAPRVGAAYDVRGDGKWKIFGSWGLFYDFFKLELPRGSFGGDKWIEYYYTLDTLRLAEPRALWLPAGVPRTLHAANRLPPGVAGQRRHRSRPEADAAAGSDRGNRSRAELPAGLGRPLRPQADRHGD